MLRRTRDFVALYERYRAGESGMEIAASEGISFSSLYRSWQRRGLRVRSMSESKRLQYVMHPDQRISHPAKMQNARRGATDPLERREQRARTRQERMVGTSRLEDAVAHHLDGLGILFVRQLAIGPYNVDFGLSDHKLVIEVDGGAHNRKVRAKRAEREARIVQDGWRIIRIKRSLARRIESGGLDNWSPI